MTVHQAIPTPRIVATLAQKPALNSRLPPFADRSSLGSKLTGLSRQKLAREATAPDPDVRRCLAHFRLHVASMEWTNKGVSSQISSFELEDEEEEEEEEEEKEEEKRDEGEKVLPVQRENDNEGSCGHPQQQEPEPQPLAADALHVSFRVAAPTLPQPTLPQTEELGFNQPSSLNQSSSPSPSPDPGPNHSLDPSPDPGLNHGPHPDPSPDPSPRKDERILERSRSCLEKTVQKKHFWSSSGQCVPVHIAS